MKNVTSYCRMCGIENEFEDIICKEMMFGSGEEFTYESCIACQSLQIKEIPDDLGRFYPDNYVDLRQSSSKSMKIHLREALVKIALRVYFSKFGLFVGLFAPPNRGDLLALKAAKPSKNDAILDMGCGKDPFLLRLLSQLGFTNLTGADPFAFNEETQIENIRILKTDLCGIRETFDIVLLNHSLEHTPDPQRELIEVARVLKPDGVAVIRLPTPSSWAYKNYGVDWAQLDAPRHLNLPSRKAMQKMIEHAGLKIVRTFDDSGELQFFGSELYKMNIGLKHPDARKKFTTREMKEFRKLAKKLNEKSMGDQVCYVLSF